MAEESNPFQDLLNAETERITATKPKTRSTTTTLPSLIKDVVTEYPRAALTAGVVGTTAYKGVTGWKENYLAELKNLQKRIKTEQKTLETLEGKGVKGITSVEGAKPVKALAREATIERMFTGFPFYNTQSAERLADIRTPRVILTGEQVQPLTTFEMGADGLVTARRAAPNFNSPYVEVKPRVVSTEAAKGIPKLKAAEQVASGASAEGLMFGLGSGGNRIVSTPAYTPTISTSVGIPKRVAQLSTGGKLGKGAAALEGVAAVYDIAREDGAIREAYRKDGALEAGLRSLGRLGRGATNALTMGAPEYLGVYDIPDLLEVESEAAKRYMRLRGTAGYPAESFPIIKKDGRYVPLDGDNPQLKAMEARVAAERGIESSLMTEGYYKGPEYNYTVQDGKVVPILRPEYSALYDARSIAAMDAANAKRPVLNVDPTLGTMGWQRLAQPAMTLQDYADYMAQPR